MNKKSGFISLTAVFSRTLIGLLNIKIISVLSGPYGLFIFGQISSLFQGVSSLYSTGSNTAILKAKKEVFSIDFVSAIILNFAISIFASIIFLISLKYSSNNEIIDGINFTTIFLLIYMNLMYSVASTYLSYLIVNKRYWTNALIRILSSLIGLITTLSIVYLGQEEYYFLWVLYPSLGVVIFGMYGLYRSKVRLRFSFLKLKYSLRRVFTVYGVMAVSGLVLPAIHLYIRGAIFKSVGLEQAGAWEAMNRTSIQFMTMVMGYYSFSLLPQFSNMESKDVFVRLKRTLIKLNRILFLILILFSLGGKFLYISLYSREIWGLLGWNVVIIMFVGDVIRANVYLMSSVLIARSNNRFFLLIEFAGLAVYSVAAYWLMIGFNMPGAVYAYVATQVILLLIIFIYYAYNRRYNSLQP